MDLKEFEPPEKKPRCEESPSIKHLSTCICGDICLSEATEQCKELHAECFRQAQRGFHLKSCKTGCNRGESLETASISLGRQSPSRKKEGKNLVLHLMKYQTESQQEATANKRPQTTSSLHSSLQNSRHSLRELPPRFMQQPQTITKQKVTSDEFGGIDSHLILPEESWLSSQESFSQFDTHKNLVVGNDSVGAPNSISGSVISSSSFTGVQGTTHSNTISLSGSHLNNNAHPIVQSFGATLHTPQASNFSGSSTRGNEETFRSSNSQHQSSDSGWGELAGETTSHNSTPDLSWDVSTLSLDGRVLSGLPTDQGTNQSEDRSDFYDAESNAQSLRSADMQRNQSAMNSSTLSMSSSSRPIVGGKYRNTDYSDGNNKAFQNHLSSYGAQHPSSDMEAKCQLSGNKDSSLSVQNNYGGWSGGGSCNASSRGWNIPDEDAPSSNFLGEECNKSHHQSDGSYEGLVGAIGGSDSPPHNDGGVKSCQMDGKRRSITSSNWGGSDRPPRIGLLGGGETSLNNGNGGWGAPPSSTAAASGWNGTNSNTGAQWGGGNVRQNGNTMESNANQVAPLPKHNTWAQAAGKGLTGNSQGSHNGNVGNAVTGSQNDQGPSSNAVTKVKMDEHISELKIAAAFSDGWGQAGVNQEASWDVPSSPQTSPKENSSSMWRSPANTGTEIWENTVRHRNKAAGNNVAVNNSQPWGHTPTTHIGGTWGEEEDTNTWTGVPQQGGSNGSWSGSNGGGDANIGGGPNNNMWGHAPPSAVAPSTPNENKHWAAGQQQQQQQQQVQQQPPPQQQQQQHHQHQQQQHHQQQHQQQQQNSASWCEPDCNASLSDTGTAVWSGNNPNNKGSNIGTWSPVTPNTCAPKNKELHPSGWEEPSSPANPNRRPGPNYDDGTSLWGNPMRQGKVCHWKEMPPAKPISNNASASGMPSLPIGGGGQNMPPTGPGMIRLPSNNPGVGKPDMGGPWGKQQQQQRGGGNGGPGGGSWTDLPHRDSPAPNWDDPHAMNQMKSIPGTPGTPGSWGDPGSPLNPYWGAKPKVASNWAEGQIDTSTWSGPSKQGGKPLSKELIWASKQFRILSEMGYKKDDIEVALRNNNMNLDDASIELQAVAARSDNGLLDVDGYGARTKVRPSGVSDDLGISEHSLDANFGPSFYGPSGFQGPQVMPAGFGSMQGFKPQLKGSGLNSNTPSLLSNPTISGQASSLNLSNSISNLSPAMVQKILQQQPQSFNTAPNIPQTPIGNQSGRMNQQNIPSPAQLRHLVQQIQMAVQAGHLNPQILNQPLAPQTLQLLYQLLQQIKVLHQLQQQQLFQSQHHSKGGSTGPGSPSPLQLNVQITQTKQRIVNLQNQIAAQQALFLKQQQLQHPATQHMPLHTAQSCSGDIFKPSLEPMPGLHSEFRDLSLKDSVPTSRLSQWKLSSLEKEEEQQQQGANRINNGGNGGNGNSSNNPGGNNNGNGNPVSGTTDFSRAPGSVTKSSLTNMSSTLTGSHSSPDLHPLLTQGDSTWSSLPRNQGDTSGWPDSNSGGGGISGSGNSGGNTSVPSSSAADTKDIISTTVASGGSSGNSNQSSYNISDLVPEFEPGKPWKGSSQMKSVEDDPHMTPGSVAQSPFSLNTIKETELFSWTSKSSPVTTSNNDSLVSSLASLTSNNTWAFTPPSTSMQSGMNSAPKQGNPKANWSSVGNDSMPGTDLWGPSMSKPRGPPPGLSGQGKRSMGGPWGPGHNNNNNRNSWQSNDGRSGMNGGGWDKPSNSNFLVLRNLTPQIDGSTLKTLCMQHGPLQLFHLFLNHGIALARYSTHEEAAKAQSALNNCVLGNTTILAGAPTESEVQQYLQLANGQMAGNSMGWSGSQPQGGSPATPSFRGSNSSFQFGSSGSTQGGKIDSNAWNGLNLPGSHVWSFPGHGGSLWGSLGDHDQNTASLNSYLPGDLLGGESI